MNPFTQPNVYGAAPTLLKDKIQTALRVLWPLALLLLTSCISDYDYGYGYEDPVAMLMADFEAALLPVKLVLAGAGLAMLLAGYKIYRFIIMVPGLILGGLAGMALGSDDGALLGVIGLFVGAVIGAGLALLIHDLMVFLTGAVIGVTLIGGAFLSGGSMPDALPLIVSAVVGGIGLLVLSKTAIVFFTSAVGALLFGMGIETTGGWLLLYFAIGVAAQYGLASVLGDKVGFGTSPAAIETAGAAAVGAGAAKTSSAQISARKPAAAPRPLPEKPSPVQATAATFIDLQGQRIALFDQMMIGRGSDASLRLLGRNVSRQHAVLRQSDEAWFIQDQNSAGGTLVNGQQVQATRLYPGDIVAIGDHTLRFELK